MNYLSFLKHFAFSLILSYSIAPGVLAFGGQCVATDINIHEKRFQDLSFNWRRQWKNEEEYTKTYASDFFQFRSDGPSFTAAINNHRREFGKHLLQLNLGGYYQSGIRDNDLLALNYAPLVADFDTWSWDFDVSQSVYGGYIFPFTLKDKHWISIYGGYVERDQSDTTSILDFDSDGWFAGWEWGRELYAQNGFFIDFVLGMTWRSTSDASRFFGLSLGDTDLTYNVWSVGLDFYGPATDSFNGFTSLKLRHDLSRAGSFGSDDGQEFRKFSENADGSFGKFAIELIRHQQLYQGEFSPGKLLIVAKLDGQHADDSVIPLEQKYIGGADTVRGYEFREFAGDSGVHASLEVISPLWIEKRSNMRLLAKAFIDYGYIRIDNPLPGEDKSEDLSGGGCGLQFRVGRFLNIEVDFAFPLKKTPSSRSGEAHMALSLLY